MIEILYMETEVLLENYNKYKYKDKSGRKAQNLLSMIQSAEAFNKLMDKVKNDAVTEY